MQKKKQLNIVENSQLKKGKYLSGNEGNSSSSAWMIIEPWTSIWSSFATVHDLENINIHHPPNNEENKKKKWKDTNSDWDQIL